MPHPVSLKNVAGELQLLNDEMQGFLNPATGEVIAFGDEDAQLAESETEPDVEWQRAWIAQIREVQASEAWLALPSQWEIHPYSIMEDFCESAEPEDVREPLLVAIRGRGAFRMFRETVARLGLEDRWYAFRDAAYARIAADWLEAHGVPFERDTGA